MKTTLLAALLTLSVLTLTLVGCRGSDPGETGETGAVSLKTISTPDLAAALDGERDLYLLDVRTPGEFAGGAIEGAINIPSYSLARRVKELDPVRDKTIVVYCEVGGRAETAARELAAAGFGDVVLYRDGMKVWRNR